jgi:hypothetical protein
MMKFEIISKISSIRTIAVGNSIRELDRLKKDYGSGRWRKLAGIATVRFENGEVTTAEIHWYEAHGIGKRDIRVKKELG